MLYNEPNTQEFFMMTKFLSHRGESDDAPENTLAAYKLAMERDSDGIELDLRLTADQQIVCFHDEDLKRVAGVPLAIKHTALEDLRAYWPAPLFREALPILEGDKIIQVELKEGPRIVPPVKALLDGCIERLPQLCFSSFETDTIHAVSEAFPTVPRILLINLEEHFGRFPEAAEALDYAKQFGCTGISFLATLRADAAFVEALHRAEMRVVCWGVGSDELGLAMAGIGVDAMTCNHAIALRAEYRKRIAG